MSDKTWQERELCEIIFTGNPNAGKSTLFNALARAHAHTGNWQGVTVGAASKRVHTRRGEMLYTDLPGVYSLDGYSMEEKTALSYLRAHPSAKLVQVVDLRVLPRSLRLTKALLQEGRDVVLALTMRKTFEKNGGKLDVAALAEKLKIPVFYVNAYNAAEVRAFNLFLQEQWQKGRGYAPDEGVKSNISDMQFIQDMPPQNSLSLEGVYRPQQRRESVLEKICYNRFLCLPLFFLLMAGVFFLTFGEGMPGTLMKDFLEEMICERLTSFVGAHLSVPAVRALVCDGFLRAAGGVLSFLPQLALLFSVLLFLEESGYMSALAFTADGVFRRFGLSGRAVFCILLGFGCTAQAIMSTRGFENKKMQRRVILALPYISCSAKLPVYLTLLSSFFSHPFLPVAVLYFLGVGVSMVVLSLLSRGETGAFLLELPEFHLPDPIFFAKTLLFRLKQFIIKIATVVAAFTLIVWFLSSFDFSLRYTADVQESILAQLSGGLKYLFYPIGVRDWQTAFALCSGLVAKENIAGLLNLFYPSGLPYSPQTAFALAVFVLFCSPCISAIAASAREVGRRNALFYAVMQTGTAVLASYIAWFLYAARLFIPVTLAGVLILLAAKRLCFERIHRKKSGYAQKFYG